MHIYPVYTYDIHIMLTIMTLMAMFLLFGNYTVLYQIAAKREIEGALTVGRTRTFLYAAKSGKEGTLITTQDFLNQHCVCTKSPNKDVGEITPKASQKRPRGHTYIYMDIDIQYEMQFFLRVVRTYQGFYSFAQCVLLIIICLQIHGPRWIHTDTKGQRSRT